MKSSEFLDTGNSRQKLESYERAGAAPRRRAPGRTAHPLVTFVCGPILIHSPLHWPPVQHMSAATELKPEPEPEVALRALNAEATKLRKRHDEITAECITLRQKLHQMVERTSGFTKSADLSTGANEDAAGRPGSKMQKMLGNHCDIRGDLTGGTLSADWTEWLMGWPIGHTDLKPLEMDKFRQWQLSHGVSLADPKQQLAA